VPPSDSRMVLKPATEDNTSNHLIANTISPCFRVQAPFLSDKSACLLDQPRLFQEKSNLVGGLEHEFYHFPHIGNVIIPTDSYFSEGLAATTNKRPCLLDQQIGFSRRNPMDFSRINRCFFPEFLVKPRSPTGAPCCRTECFVLGRPP